MGKQPAKKSTLKGVAAKSSGLVCSCLQALNKWVNEVYSMRHAGTVAKEGAKVMPLPVGHGGTFKQILQRAWANPEDLLTGSLEMMKDAGCMGPDSTLEDLGTLVTVKADFHLRCSQSVNAYWGVRQATWGYQVHDEWG